MKIPIKEIITEAAAIPAAIPAISGMVGGVINGVVRNNILKLPTLKDKVLAKENFITK